MKIIYIAETRIPSEMAQGLQVMKMCEAFAKQGIELELVVPRRIRIFSTEKENPFDYYRVEKIFKITKLLCFDLTPLNRFLGPVSFLIQALSFSFFAFIYLLFRLARQRGGKPDIIYGRDRFSLFLISFFRRNIVFEVHKTHKFLFWGILKRVKKIIVITKGIKDILVKKGIEKEKILVAPDAVDFEKFDIPDEKMKYRQQLNLPPNNKIVLYTGHLYKWKGVETLAMASKYLNPKFYTLNPDILIVIVGGIKWYLISFKKFVKKNNLKNILILGYQDYSKIPYFLKAADCLILIGTRNSDVSQYQTSPMKMFEYMASKRPIIASDLPSFREILNDQNSILVEPNSPEKLAGGLKKVLDNQELAQRISEQAYRDVQKYTWDKRVQKILEFIA